MLLAETPWITPSIASKLVMSAAALPIGALDQSPAGGWALKSLAYPPAPTVAAGRLGLIIPIASENQMQRTIWNLLIRILIRVLNDGELPAPNFGSPQMLRPWVETTML